jgi:hypothetical protein
MLLHSDAAFLQGKITEMSKTETSHITLSSFTPTYLQNKKKIH